MKLFPEGRSRALSACSLAAAAGSCVMFLKALRDLFTLLDVFSTPAFYLALSHASVPVEMPPLALFMAGHMRLAFVFSVFFWLSGLTLSVGVWGRKEWARRGAVTMLYLLSATALLFLLFPWLAIPRPLVYDGVSLAPEFNAAVRAAALVARITAALAGGLCLWWALALDRGELRREFGGGVERAPGI